MSAAAGTPRLQDLAFHLYRRALHPELLAAARSRVLEGPALRARVGLLARVGHVVEVTVTPGPHSLVEVVLPLAEDLPGTGRIELLPAGSLGRGTITSCAGVVYEAASWLERLGQDAFARRSAELLADPGPPGRLVVVHGDGAPASLLDARLEGGRLVTHVVHVLPADRALLFLESTFAAE